MLGIPMDFSLPTQNWTGQWVGCLAGPHGTPTSVVSDALADATACRVPRHTASMMTTADRERSDGTPNAN